MPLLIVQKGHCYRTTGATGTTGEQAYATAVADACVRLLHGKGGWSVRPTLADENTYRGDALVAIHCDGSTSSTARGASIGYRTPEGQTFGQAWKRAYAERGWTGGFRPDNYTAALAQYYGTGNAVAAGTRRAFIAECGFRTNPDDRALLDAPGGADRVALAIGDALGIPHTPLPTPTEEDEDVDYVIKSKRFPLGVLKLGDDLVGLSSAAESANWVKATGREVWSEDITVLELVRLSRIDETAFLAEEAARKEAAAAAGITAPGGN